MKSGVSFGIAGNRSEASSFPLHPPTGLKDESGNMKKRLDLHTTGSSHSGTKGFFEKVLRKFKILSHLALLPAIYLTASLCLGLSLVPGIAFFRYLIEITEKQTTLIQNLALGFSIAVGYFLYGFTLIFVTPTVNFLIRGKLKAWRGPYYSVETFKWYLHNGLTYLVRYTFLEFATPTPLSQLFYRMMGMKIGKGTTINSTYISDPSLIELGDHVTIGGSVTIVAHYGQGGLMVISPVKIGSGCTVGLRATIMGGVTLGDNVRIMPNSVVLPKTVIPAGESWGGVPAVKIETGANAQLPKLAIS
ncbi:MAG: hypothetical protein IPK04_07815 [Bdellovibrionales bacterium]|nr:hypothetical protein [Bdellovibrionales bacterium]